MASLSMYHQRLAKHSVGSLIRTSAAPLRSTTTFPNFLSFFRYSGTKSATMVRPEGTESFKFNHTMFRIKDPKVSLEFYQNVIGMELLQEMKMSDFTNYFLAFPDDATEHQSIESKAKARFHREGILELCHNHGTESDESFQGYANGNKDGSKGFGHIAISVKDINAACERFEKLGVNFQKRLSDGRMKTIAFITDPDGYWIEVVPQRGDV